MPEKDTLAPLAAPHPLPSCLSREALRALERARRLAALSLLGFGERDALTRVDSQLPRKSYGRAAA